MTTVQDVAAGSVVVRPVDFAVGTVVVRVPGVDGVNGVNTPPGGTPDYRLASVSGAAVSWADVFKLPTGLARFATPEQFGAPADGTNDDTAAIRLAQADRVAAGGGTVLLTGPYYRSADIVQMPGVVFQTLNKGQLATGAGFPCTIRPPTGWAGGWMFDGYIAQKVTIVGATGGSYTLTGGWGGSGTTSAINQSDNIATILTKVRALPGFGAVTLDAAATPSLYRIELDQSIGNTTINGSRKPAKLTVANSLTGTTPTVTVKALSCDGAGIHGVALIGTVAATGASSQGGIRMRDQTRFCADGITGNGFNRGLLTVGGVGSNLTNISGLNFPTTSMTEPIGVVNIYGADHTLDNAELSGITLPGASLADATNKYHCALVISSATTVVRNVLAEFGDTDIWSAGGMCRFEHCRTDMAGANGIYETIIAFDNRYTDTLILGCGHATDNTYDGMSLNGIGHQVRGVSGEVAVNSISTNRMRYVVFENDSTADPQTLRTYPSSVEGLVADVNCYGTDDYASTFGYPCRPSSGGNPSVRPQSAHMLGRTWYDSRASRLTYSDGTRWRDASGDLVGNLLAGSLSTMKSSSGWQSSTGTLTRIDGHAAFKQPWMVQAVTLAAGVTAGYVEIASTGAASQPVIDVGRQYTAPVHAFGPTGTTVTPVLTWKDAGGSAVGSPSIATAQAVGTTDTLAIATFPDLAPVGTTQAVLSFRYARSGLAVGDIFGQARATLVPGSTANESEYP